MYQLNYSIILVSFSLKGENLRFVLLFHMQHWLCNGPFFQHTYHCFALISSILQLAKQTFKEALGDGIWLSFFSEANKTSIDAATSTLQFKDMQLFHDLESNGHHVEVPWDKVTVLFNLARLLEQLNESGTASVLYRLILFKVRLDNLFVKCSRV